MYNPNYYYFPRYSMPFSRFFPNTGINSFRNINSGMHIFRRINWSNLLNNTQRALGVVNQAIPIVKQAGPMFSNMRSMLKVASAFKDVTDDNSQKKDTSNTNNLNSDNDYNYNYNYNQPNFFI